MVVPRSYRNGGCRLCLRVLLLSQFYLPGVTLNVQYRGVKLTRTLVPRSQVPRLNTNNDNLGSLKSKNKIHLPLLSV